MESMPKISIVTPNFNGGAYLEETILSVLGQNYPKLEYIVIDGGSTDESQKIIKKYEKQLKWWVSEPDNGMYHAIQKGFEHSSSEIMAWINSDDMYHRNAFYIVAEIFSSFKQVNWLLGASTTYDEFGRTINCNPSRLFTKYDYYNRDFKWIQQESVFWRRTLWEKSGSNLNIQLKYAGDFDLWFKFFQNEPLFVTNALRGGFRIRRANQISLDHMEEYLQEVETTISRINLNSKEKRVLQNYQFMLKIESFLQRLKFFRTDWFINRFRSKYFSKPSRIDFDQT